MKCEDVDRLMLDFLDNNLGKEVIFQIEQHLYTCERCLDEVKDFKEILGRMSDTPGVAPDPALRINFYHMLHGEINKGRGVEMKTGNVRSMSQGNWLKVAAGVALLVAGTFAGMLIHSGTVSSGSNRQLSQLKTEVNDLKKITMMTMLNQESSCDRIQAVRYADDLTAPDQNITDALVRTLNTDKNINVRIAAANALGKFAGDRRVCDSLVKSLAIQTDPLVQVALINLLAARREKSALEPIRRIIGNKNTLNEVRSVAENSLHVLI